MRNSLVKARVQAEGQAIAGGVDVVDQPVEIVALVADHVQDRAEDFALEVGELFQLDDRRRHEGAFSRRRQQRDLLDLAAEPRIVSTWLR
jgi:hypothetical protein